MVARRRERDPLAELTEREREVLALMAQGLSNAALSEELALSPKTIEGYVRTVFAKLGLEPGERDNRRVLAVLQVFALAVRRRRPARCGGRPPPAHRLRQRCASASDEWAAALLHWLVRTHGLANGEQEVGPGGTPSLPHTQGTAATSMRPR